MKNVVLIALPLITLGETRVVDIADMIATTFLIRVVQNIDFVGGVIIAIRICHDRTSISR